MEVVKSFCLGQDKFVNVLIYEKKNETKKPSYLFDIKFSNGNILIIGDCSKRYNEVEYATQEDAVDAALDFLIDHANFHTIDKKDLNAETPENESNVEEVPEDFRLNMNK